MTTKVSLEMVNPAVLDRANHTGTQEAASITGTFDADHIPADLTPDKAFRRGNVLGTVSQSGGVPTGAIIYRASNSAGEVVRYADGTQICTSSAAASMSADQATGQIFRSSSGAPWNFPAEFIAAPSVTASIDNSSSMWVNCYSPTTTLVNFRAYSSGSVATTFNVRAVAVGRWF